MRRLLTIVPLLAVAAAAVAWRIQDVGSDDPAVIRVDDDYVTANEYRDEYIDYLNGTGLSDDRQRRLDFADRLVGIQLVSREARDKNFASDADFVRQVETLRQKLLVDYYVSEKIYGDLEPTEDELREMFVRVNTSLKARHLYAPDLESATKLRARLDAGESFESLAHEVFSDPVLADGGGSVGYFSFDEMDPAFEDAAFSLKIGEISDPVRTSTGYSIIQLEDSQVKPILTESEYAAKKDKMWQYVSYRKRLDARRSMTESMIATLDPLFDDSGLDALFAVIAGAVSLDTDEARLDLDAMPLVSFGAGEDRTHWTIGEFRAYAEHTSTEQREAVKSREFLIEFVKGLVVRHELLQRATTAGLQSNPEFVRALAKGRSGLLYDRGYRELVDGVVVPVDSVREYYRRYEGQFQMEPTVLVYEILTESETVANAALEKLRATDFESVASAYSIRPGAASSGGRLGYVTRPQLGVLGEKLFDAPLNQVVGPLEIDGRYGIFEVRDRVDRKQASFEEVENEIGTFLQKKMAREFLRAHVDSLRARYPVDVDREMILQIELSKHS